MSSRAPGGTVDGPAGILHRQEIFSATIQPQLRASPPSDRSQRFVERCPRIVNGVERYATLAARHITACSAHHSIASRLWNAVNGSNCGGGGRLAGTTPHSDTTNCDGQSRSGSIA